MTCEPLTPRHKSTRIRGTAGELYLRVLLLALRALARGQVVESAKLLIAPIGYWRFLPLAYVWQEFLRFRNPKVLDVGSPKALSVLLAFNTSNEVYSSDLNDEKIFTRWKPLAEVLRLQNYATQYQDARKLDYPDDFFELVYSISVIEHIPGNGDTESLREFCRVLRPNGTLVIEVPYRRRREEVFTKYDSAGRPTEQMQFYERHYDADLLKERLEVEGLKIVDKVILGEWLPIDPWIVADRLPRFLRLAALPLEPILAAGNCWTRPDDSTGRPLGALIVYQKILCDREPNSSDEEHTTDA
jgi:SAM-dependent methyltransferase